MIKEFRFKPTDDLMGAEVYLRLRLMLPADDELGHVPTYVFRICNAYTNEFMGEISLRVGFNRDIYYAGHIGYNVLPEYRGHNYAQKACQVVFKQARKHGMSKVLITCNPDNIPSRRTCENLGGVLKEIVDLPEDSELYEMGDRQKCIFEVDIS